MILLLAALLVRNDAYTVTLNFQSMHCEECKGELSQRLERIRGVQSVRIEGRSAVAEVDEKAKFDLGGFRSARPRDMKLLEVRVSLRGRVSEASGRFKVTAKGSCQVFDLANPERQDPLGDLKNQLGGTNKFRIDGVALDSTRIELQSFSKTDYE